MLLSGKVCRRSHYFVNDCRKCFENKALYVYTLHGREDLIRLVRSTLLPVGLGVILSTLYHDLVSRRTLQCQVSLHQHMA